MEIAVNVNGRGEEGRAFWVIEIDPVGERFLIVDGAAFVWVSIADCTLGKAISPDQPILVLPVQPSPAPSLALPNREQRRNGNLM